MDGLREAGVLAAEPASIPALRATLFLFAVGGALAWRRGRPMVSSLIFAFGGLLGLSFWLIQIASPFGLSTDPERAKQWAQAGVNAALHGSTEGFVAGTPAESSFLSTAASAGLSAEATQVLPQVAGLAILFLIAATPHILISRRSTAAFASVLAVSGGLWPGFEPFSLILRSLAQWVAAVCLIVVAMILKRRARKILSGRLPALIAIAALCVGLSSRTSRTWAVWPLIALSILASPRVRAFIRRLSSYSKARSLEAAVLLVVFCGSGLFWWDPATTLNGFMEARDRGDAIRKPMAWIAANVPTQDVVLASAAYSAPIAAFAGRRVLFRLPGEEGIPLPEPFKRIRLLESAREGAPIARLAEDLHVTHLLLGPGEKNPAPSPDAKPSGEVEMSLQLVYQDGDDFRVFRLIPR